MVEVSTLMKARSSPPHVIQAGFEAHPTPYPIGTAKVLYPG
jgi:hypothetical protein